MKRGNIFFSPAEEEIVNYLKHFLMNDGGNVEAIAEMEAVQQVVQQKRELAFEHGRRGNLALARHLKMELDEWSVEDEERFIEIRKTLEEVKK